MHKLLSFVVAIAAFFSSITATGGCSGSSGTMTDEWKEIVAANYAEFISEVENNENAVPMIVTTDQHGAVTANCDIYSYFNEIVDWSKISKILNLGDTVSSMFNVKELIDYQVATRCLPDEKRIEITGNHDRFDHATPVGLFISNLFFYTPNSVRSSDGRAFTVTDEDFGVRYLGVDTNNFPWRYVDGTMPTSLADYIVGELSKTDDSDIIFFSHSYIFRDCMIRRNGETFTGSENFIGDGEKYAEQKQSFIDMLSARKNKASGVLLDTDGVEHPYDFSQCKGDFLMTLHGHHHTEGYETKDGITEFLFQSMTKDNAQNTEPNCTYFAYIDKEAKTFKVWKNLEGYSAWEISIA